MTCIPQNGLKTIIGLNGVVTGCEEICGDEMLYSTTVAEQDKFKSMVPPKDIGGAVLQTKH